MSQGIIKDSNEDILRILHADLDEQITPLSHKRASSILKNTISDKDCTRFLHDTNFWSAEKSWKGLPKKATSHRPLTTHLRVIMLEILQFFNYVEKPNRDTNPNTRATTTRLTRSQHNTTAPPAGAATLPERRLQLLPRRRQPLEQLKRQPDGLITGTTNHFKPSSEKDSWYRAVAAFDVRTDRERVSDVESGRRWLFDLAYYALEIFSTQKTRQFVYGLIISESHLRVCRFDRCGAVEWPWLNYRDDPTILIRTLLLISNHDLKAIGVDPTVTFNATNQREFIMVRKGKPVIYTEVDTTFASIELCERATMCWVVNDKSGNRYLLKQQAADVKRLTEGEHLKGVDIPGIAKIHFEQRYEKMSTSRGQRKPYPDSFYDRVMVRSIFDLYGGPVDVVRSRKGLLLALYDAIFGHRDLWLKHNILHRDISFGNILYAEGEENEVAGKGFKRPHGVLIDFDLSSRYDPTLPREKYELFNQTGTTCFQSLNTVLADWYDSSPTARWKPLHDHIEELETFFWVLYWITSLDSPPDEAIRPNNLLSAAKPAKQLHTEFHNDDCETSAAHKLNVLRYKRSTMAVPKCGWGKAYEQLIMSFATFCNNESHRKKQEACVGGLAEPVIMEESRERAPRDYETVLSFIQKAIDDLDLELKIPDAPKRTARPLREVHRPQAATQRPVVLSNGSHRKRSRESDGHVLSDPITEPAESPKSKRGRM